MRNTRTLAILLCLLPLSTSCDSNWFNRPINKNVVTTVESDRSGLGFGGDTPFLTMNITGARSECIPYRLVNEKESKDNSTHFCYKLPITADIHAVLIDQYRIPAIPLTAKIRFEAISSNNVILGSSDADVQYHSGQAAEQASSAIYGLNEYEIERVSKIRVYWLYER